MTIKIDDNGDFEFDERFEFKCTDEEAFLIKKWITIFATLAKVFETLDSDDNRISAGILRAMDKAGM